MSETEPKSRAWYDILGHVRALPRTQLLIYAGLAAICLSVGGLIDATFVSVPGPVTPPEFRMGWDEAVALKEVPAIAAAMPPASHCAK